MKNRADLLQEYQHKKSQIQKRLKEFRILPEKAYKKEFLFCILTPQSNAQKCWQAIEELEKIENPTEAKVKEILKKKTRFHNNKTRYILEAVSSWEEIKQDLNHKNRMELRDSLAKKVKGYGLKEAGHFLRNIGKSENKIAILDRHILKHLKTQGVIKEEKIRSAKHYREIEEKFKKFSKKIKIPIDELDLLFWSNENGEIFR